LLPGIILGCEKLARASARAAVQRTQLAALDLDIATLGNN
jgi:hypothetical protein